MSIRYSTFARDAMLLIAVGLGIYAVVRPVAGTRNAPVDAGPDRIRFDPWLAESKLANDVAKLAKEVETLKLRPGAVVEIEKALGPFSLLRKDLDDSKGRLDRIDASLEAARKSQNGPNGSLQFGNLLICWGTWSSGESGENIRVVDASSVPGEKKPNQGDVCLSVTYPVRFGSVPQLALDRADFSAVAPSASSVFLVGVPVRSKNGVTPPKLVRTHVRYYAIGIAAAPAP